MKLVIVLLTTPPAFSITRPNTPESFDSQAGEVASVFSAIIAFVSRSDSRGIRCLFRNVAFQPNVRRSLPHLA